MFRDTCESVPFSGAVAQDTVGTLKLFEDVPFSLLREGNGLFLAMVHPHVVQLEFLRSVDLRTVVAWLDHDTIVHPVWGRAGQQLELERLPKRHGLRQRNMVSTELALRSLACHDPTQCQ